MSNDNIIGNFSTIAVWIYTILAPFIAQYVSQEVFLAIFGLILAVWSSANPNTFKFLKNNLSNCSCEVEETVMNDEYETTDDEGC